MRMQAKEKLEHTKQRYEKELYAVVCLSLVGLNVPLTKLNVF